MGFLPGNFLFDTSLSLCLWISPSISSIAQWLFDTSLPFFLPELGV